MIPVKETLIESIQGAEKAIGSVLSIDLDGVLVEALTPLLDTIERAYALWAVQL